MTAPSPRDRSETLEALVFEILERMEKEGPGAIESAVSEHPELEQELRSRLVSLQAMGLLSAEESTPLAVPSSLGNYQLGARLGEGGMGLVFQARDAVLDREVALKLIRPELVASGSLRERFQRESLAIARLQHPAVGRVYDAGEIGGFPYIAMERIDGCTLGQVLDSLDGESPEALTGRDFHTRVEQLSHRSLPASSVPPASGAPGLFAGTWGETCLRIGLAVAEGLSCAHSAGVLHRDVKASNVMVTPTGRVLLIDFGLAQIDSAAGLTTTGGRLGSLPYIAPERIVDASPATEAADVYALGVLMYELLTLRLPFRASSESALVKLIAAAQPTPLAAINPGVKPLFREVTARAMRRDPARRPPTAADYALDLSRVLAGKAPLPHGDGVIAALRSRLRAQPVVTGALLASAAVLLALPATYLTVKAHAAERTAELDRRSLERLGLALRAADQLQNSFEPLAGDEEPALAALHRDVLQALVGIRSEILGDQRFSLGDESTRQAATRSQAAALASLQQLALSLPQTENDR